MPIAARISTFLMPCVMLVLCGCASIVRDRIYLPSSDARAPRIVGSMPSDVSVTTHDGLRLGGFWWKAERRDAPVLVFFHGRSGGRNEAAEYAEPLASIGANLLVTSYRGYGGNPGAPNERDLIADARAFILLAERQAPGSPIYLVGHSLGAAVALQAAARGSGPTAVAGVFTIGAFTDLADAAPKLVRGMLPDRYDNEGAIGDLANPAIIMHARDDTVVPVAQARRLLEIAPTGSLLLILGTGDHRPDMSLISKIVGSVVEKGTGDVASLTALAREQRFAIFRKDAVSPTTDRTRRAGER